ncbi:MAG TPA: hypothetical protein VKU85_05685, partial [bacterium]|nr:hypothetical protein [bacterium]
MRRSPHTPALLAAALAALAPSASLATGEEGGSGLIRVGQAYSLPIGRPLISLYAGYYTSNPVASDRLFTLIPSATFGLGSGFEAAGALPLEGATLALENDPFDRRFDLRHRDLLARARWTGPLKTTRFRVGIEGTLGAPLGGRTRSGGDRTPQSSLDPGITGLLSTNIGAFDFPIRVHANAGWWWSRNDGAFYYRGYPASVAVPGGADAGNDVGWVGLALEAGLRRATVIVEVVTEHFQEARVEVHGRENLWMLTTGFRTALSRTVGLTGAVSFDLSADDEATRFDPDDVFPDAEIRVGLTLGTVLSREEYEARKRAEADARRERPAASSGGSPASFTPPAAAPGGSGEPAGSERIAELEARVRDLDTRLRLESLENRLRQLEAMEAAGPGG